MSLGSKSSIEIFHSKCIDNLLSGQIWRSVNGDWEFSHRFNEAIKFLGDNSPLGFTSLIWHPFLPGMLLLCGRDAVIRSLNVSSDENVSTYN